MTASATEISGKLTFGDPKTHEARTVIIPKSVALLLASNRQLGRHDDLIFTAPRGGPLRTSNFGKQVWVPALTALLDRYPELDGLRVQDLRHTAASMAISCGANVKVVQRMLGHKLASMTLDIYASLYTEDLEDLADRLDNLFVSVA